MTTSKKVFLAIAISGHYVHFFDLSRINRQKYSKIQP